MEKGIKPINWKEQYEKEKAKNERLQEKIKDLESRIECLYKINGETQRQSDRHRKYATFLQYNRR